MSCAGYFEKLRRQAEQESFNNKVLPEIEDKKNVLKRRLASLEVKGDFHKVAQVQAKLEKLEKVTERMKQLLGLDMKVYEGLGTGSVVGAKLVSS